MRCGPELVLFGGCDATGRFLDDLFALQCDTGQWRLLGSSALNGEPWPKARHFHAAAAVDNRYLYVLFGKSNGYLGDVHRCTLATATWERLEPPAGSATPSKRYGHSIVQWRDHLYIYGGFDDFGLKVCDGLTMCVNVCDAYNCACVRVCVCVCVCMCMYGHSAMTCGSMTGAPTRGRRL